jgi:hypothetical protein
MSKINIQNTKLETHGGYYGEAQVDLSIMLKIVSIMDSTS